MNSRHLPVTVLLLVLTAAGSAAAQDATPYAPVVAQERAVLDAFVKKIQADGVKVTKPVSTNADGLKTAMVVDSLGNEIELTEGLAGK